jgi:hypothetical protein
VGFFKWVFLGFLGEFFWVGFLLPTLLENRWITMSDLHISQKSLKFNILLVDLKPYKHASMLVHKLQKV